MSDLGQSPFVWLDFDAEGAIDPAEVQELTGLLERGEIEDLVVISHGWKNDKTDATRLYKTLWENTCANLPADKPRRMVVAGILWPAKAYSTDFDVSALAAANSGGALSAGSGSAPTDLSEEEFQRGLSDFNAFIGPKGSSVAAIANVAAGGYSSSQARELVTQGVAAVGIRGSHPDTELNADGAPLWEASGSPTQAQLMLSSLTMPPSLKVSADVGKAQGLGDALAGLFAGPRAAVARFLNLLTYYEMKNRAGIVGAALALNVLSKLAPSKVIKLHLVGHSFGGRLVTSAANALDLTGTLQFQSLTLLQGAFSHNAMAAAVAPGVQGAFSHVVGKPKGSITVTHTHNDVACTLLYALASRLSRDIAKGIGDASDEYGAMGANGPQKLDADAVSSYNGLQAFRPVSGKVNALLADEFILKTASIDAHNNVTNPDCGKVLARTIQS